MKTVDLLGLSGYERTGDIARAGPQIFGCNNLAAQRQREGQANSEFKS
jgi:hypothetical protein